MGIVTGRLRDHGSHKLMHGERGHARRTWTQQQAYWSVEPEGCCGSKELARGGDISPHRQGPRSMTLGYVSLAGSSQHSPRATICRYSVAGPAEGRLQTRPIMFCTTSHQHLSERGLSRGRTGVSRRKGVAPQPTWAQPSATTVLSRKGFGAGNPTSITVTTCDYIWQAKTASAQGLLAVTMYYNGKQEFVGLHVYEYHHFHKPIAREIPLSLKNCYSASMLDSGADPGTSE